MQLRMLKTYKCNYKKNKECSKSHCKYRNGIEGCTDTTKWKYAKKTPVNYIKRIINIIRGVMK